jgi:hypothetical protein
MLLDVEQITVSLVGDTSRTLNTYAHGTNQTLQDVVNEALADWADTVAAARLESFSIHRIK